MNEPKGLVYIKLIGYHQLCFLFTDDLSDNQLWRNSEDKASSGAFLRFLWKTNYRPVNKTSLSLSLYLQDGKSLEYETLVCSYDLLRQI